MAKSESNNSTFLIKNVGIVFVFTLIAKLLGFVKEAEIANSFGATYLTDAYTIAFQIPIILFDVIGQAISTCFIPVASKVYYSNSHEEYNKFANLVITVAFTLSFLLFIFAFHGNSFIIRIMAPGFNSIQYDTACELTKISSILLFFLPIISCVTASLQICGKFHITSSLSLVVNVPPITYLLFGKNIYFLMISICIGYLIQVIILVTSYLRSGNKYYPTICIFDKNFISMLKMFFPIVLGLGVKEINSIVDRIMASFLPEGNMSHYNYAYRIENSISVVVASAFITVFFPKISKIVSDREQFKREIESGLSQMLIILMPMMLLSAYLGKRIIKIIYERGEFSTDDTNATAMIFIILCCGIIFHGLRDLLNRIFYAMGETKKTSLYSIASLLINIVGNLILVNFMGVYGLAIASIISVFFLCCMLLIDLTKKNGYNFTHKLSISISKALIASIGMLIILIILDSFINIISENDLFHCFIDCFFGISTYIACLILLKEDFVNDIIKMKKRNR